MTRFYTKKGDDGYTSLLGEGRVAKYDLRIEALGSIDEANAAIAVARTLSQAPIIAVILMDIQKDLYYMMAEVAATPDNALKFRKITAERLEWLENRTDELSSQVNIPSEFILPGDSRAGAAIDLARAIVSRAERNIAQLFSQKLLENREILRYMNRLSSLCFVLELYENKAAGISAPTLAKD
jgi:cob(I)alamin adenosyltransferase